MNVHQDLNSKKRRSRVSQVGSLGNINTLSEMNNKKSLIKKKRDLTCLLIVVLYLFSLHFITNRNDRDCLIGNYLNSTQDLNRDVVKQHKLLRSNTNSQEERTSQQQQERKAEQEESFPQQTNQESICPSILQSMGADTSSTSNIWHHLQQQIIHGSFFPQQLQDSKPYQHWIQTLYKYYTVDKLRRTIAHPASPKVIAKLSSLMREYRLYNSQNQHLQKQIRILILGGSVTAGHDCRWPDWLGNDKPDQSNHQIPFHNCAWPARFENLLNTLFGDVFHVDNLASGGASSVWGSMLLERRLFNDPDTIPDIIISAYSANDAKRNDGTKPSDIVYGHMQDLIQAAQDLQPCEHDLPLVIMADDFYGDLPYQASRFSSYVYQLSQWSNLMAVSGSSVLRYKLLQELMDAETVHPLVNSNFGIHLGMGFHMGMAWIMLFNFVNAFVSVCNDEHVGINYLDETEIGKVGVNSTIAGDPNLLPSIVKGEPSAKHFAHLDESLGTVADVSRHYQENVERRKKLCENKDTIGKCTYSWFVNMAGSGVSSKAEINDKMRPVLYDYEGWPSMRNAWWGKGTTTAHQVPKISWSAKRNGATFTMKLDNVTSSTKYVLLQTMKSYSDEWKGSKLQLVFSILRNGQVLKKDWYTHVDNSTVTAHYIDGYHKDKTSVYYPHRFPLPQNGADIGDTVIMNATLVGGSKFQISGISFCAI
ncbi:hypothetical protein CTEN210_01001 [Chaetoceros tenuissimus]|uniref:Uncharacterized protein n=1 Tax=Chaetoceros tenuissimus TaxID=426638 RepID=A0AAD3CEA6_9STRA|nr:hypothetical protein CTEN210_01001 [Chaetoceros tenuissimus]